jgi:ADP-ribosyl-[dinitrogen reductase] hydrolase
VLGLSEVPEPGPGLAYATSCDRALGAMLGLAIGDALGTTLEFAVRDTKPRLTDIVGGGPFRLEPGQWTDDTAMALALADSLGSDARLDENDLMTRFASWHETGAYSCTGTCFDIGGTVSAALRRFKGDGNPFAGSSAPMSAGNGSLMRLAPVAIRHWASRETLRDVAARQSRTTHAAPEAVDACIAFADVLADAIEGRPRSQVMRCRDHPYAGKIGAIMAGSWRGKHRNEIRASGYVAHSLEAALWCVGRTGCFADAVILAANLGEDADTTAAITGQLAGALYGLGGITESWLGQLAWREEIEAKARALFEAEMNFAQVSTAHR